MPIKIKMRFLLSKYNLDRFIASFIEKIMRVINGFLGKFYNIAIRFKCGLKCQILLFPDFDQKKRPIINININDIKYVDTFLRNKKNIRFFWAGDWDKHKITLEKYKEINAKNRSMYQLFIENKQYHETDLYHEIKDRLKKWGYNDENAEIFLKEYFDNTNKTYLNIKKNGYKTQVEQDLMNKYRAIDEIGVCIDRYGNFVKTRGAKHRFAIAKILGIEVVPVVIHGVHYLWAKECFNKNKNSKLDIAIKKELEKFDRSRNGHN